MATRKEEIKKYNEAKKLYQEAYATASDDVKQKVQDVMSESRGRTSADPLNNRDARQYATQMYENALAILNGNYVESPEAETPQRKAITGYNLAGNITNANNVTNYGLHNPEQRTSSTSNPSNTNTIVGNSNTNGTYFFNWQDGLSSTWGNTNDTLSTKIGRYAQALMENLSNAQDANSQGKKMRKISQKQLGFLNDDIAKLSNILQRAGSDPEGAYNDLVSVATHYDPDGEHFKAYFGNSAPGNSQWEQNIAKLKSNNYELIEDGDFGERLNKLISDNGYHVAKKNNNYYLIDEDYTGPISNKASTFFNTDWHEGNEGFGYAINNDGRFIFGDLNDAYSNTENPFSKQIQKYVLDLKNEDRFIENDFNRFTSYSKFDIINKLALNLHKRKVADLSAYFDGDVPAIATVEGDNWAALKTKYGHTKVDDNRITYHWISDGQIKSGKYNDFIRANPTAKLNIFKTDGSKGYTQWDDLELNLDEVTSSFSNFFTRRDANLQTWWQNSLRGNRKSDWNNYLEWTPSDAKKFDMDHDIAKQKPELARTLLEMLSKGEKSLKHDRMRQMYTAWWTEHPKDAIYLIYTALKEDPTLFKGPHEQDYLNAWFAAQQMVKSKLKEPSINADTTLNKEGGILCAKEGEKLDINGNVISPVEHLEGTAQKVRQLQNKRASEINTLKENAALNGRTVQQQSAIESDAWTSSDTLRATALATDVVGLIGAMTSAATEGVGSAVAVGAGFASMGLDAIADFTDRKVSAGQAWKNLGINAGLAIAAAVGGKAPKIVKSAVKMIPKAMMAIGTAGIVLDPEVQKTAAKITKGENLNINDWKNINIILRTAIGIGTVSATKRGSNKALKKFDKEVASAMEKEGINVNGEKIFKIGDKELPAAEIKSINEHLKNNPEDLDGAAKQLAKLLGDESPDGITAAKEFFKSKEFRKWNKPWKKQKQIELKFEEELKNAGLDSLDNEVKAELYEKFLRENQLQNKGRFTQAMDRMDKFVEKASFGAIKQQNYALNAVAGRSGMSAKEIAKFIEDNKAAIARFDLQEFNVKTYRKNMQAAIDHKISDVDNATQNYEQKKAIFESAKKDAEDALAKVTDLSNKLKNIDIRINKLGISTKGQAVHNLKVQRDAVATEMYQRMDEVNKHLAVLGGSTTSSTFTSVKSKIDAVAHAQQALQDLQRTNPGLFKKDGTLSAKGKKSKIASDAIENLRRANRSLSKKTRQAYEAYQTAEQHRADYESTYQQALDDVTRAQGEYDQLRTLERDLRNRRQRVSAAGNLQALTKQSDAANLAMQKAQKQMNAASKHVDNVKNWNKQNLAAKRVEALSKQQQKLPALSKEVVVTSTSGVTQTIPSGSKVESYVHLRNEAQAKAAAQTHNKGTIELSADQAKKLVHRNSREFVRGAFYNPKTHKLSFFEAGGQIESKYQHLRK